MLTESCLGLRIRQSLCVDVERVFHCSRLQHSLSPNNSIWFVSMFSFSKHTNCTLALFHEHNIFQGLVYLFLKHLVDRYNIYFAYNPSKIDRDIHFSAVNFVIVAGFLLQLFVLFFAYLRSSKTRFLLPAPLAGSL